MGEYDYNIASVEKAFNIIELMSLNNGGMSVTEIAKALDSSISSVNRFLLTLLDIGYVGKDYSSNRYYLTNKFHVLSNKLLTQNKILERYVPLANYISNNYFAMVNINSYCEGSVLHLYKDSKVFFSKELDFKLGDTVPAYCCSAGKIMLSEFTEKELLEYFAKTSLIKYQPNTLSRESEIRKEIELVKTNGYSVHDSEYIMGLFSISFPLPNIYKQRGCITVIVPSSEKNRILNSDFIEAAKNKINQ
ncbi:Pca regulon regulatory protein [Clostridiales bacterium]|nr:Pca regulon regulatory protein [Clostridiales bacterium]